MKTELVTTLKRHASRVLSDLHATAEPVVIREHGKPSAYLVDQDSNKFRQNRIQILDGIARGERAILEKRSFSHAEAKQKMKKWLG